MKVLFSASVFRHLTAFHIPYMELLQKKGYEVWAVGNGDPEAKRILERRGVKCITINFSRNPISPLNIKAYLELKQLTSQQEFSLVHVHTPVAAFLTRLAFRNVVNCKILYTAHGFHFYRGAPKKNWILFFNAEKVARRWTDGIIVMNKEDYNNAKKLGYSEKSLYFVHGVGVQINEISNERFYNAIKIKKELGIDENSTVISFVAELNENKNHQFLLRNWHQITKECSNSILLIIGTGEKKTELQNYINENKFNNIKMLGYRDDVTQLLEITDILMLLSKREGLPKSIMEAMAARIPCIGTDTRGIRDLVQNGVNGFIVSHDDDISLQQSVITLLKESALRKKMGEKGYNLVQAYNINNVLNEYENIYDYLLNSPSKMIN